MKIIAQRTTNRDTQVGFITPVYITNENKELKLAGGIEKRKERFPNTGTVVILRDYYNLYHDYDSHEFFSIEVEPTSNYEEYTPNSCKFQTLDADTSTASKLPLLLKKPFTYTEQITLPYSGHKYIYIEDGEYIYGPISIFQVTKNDSENIDYVYYIEPLNTVDLNIDEQFESTIFKFKKSQIENRIVRNSYGVQEEEFYVFETNEILAEITPAEYILTETNEQIIEWSTTAFPEGFSEEKTKTWLSKNDGNSVVDKIRFQKFTLLKEKTTSWINFLESFISTKFITSLEGQQKIDQYIKNNTEDLIRGYELQFKKEISDRNKELNDNLFVLEKNKQQEQLRLKQLQDEIGQLTNQKDLLYAKSEELNKIEYQIQEKVSQLTVLKDFENAKIEYSSLLSTINNLTNTVNERKKELNELQNEYTEEAQKGSHKKIVELMPYVKALTGYFPDTMENISKKQSSLNYRLTITEESIEIDQYISKAKNFLENKGRLLGEIEVANLLTCIHQNFLTIFSGLPGVGKSSLSRLLGTFIAPTELYLEIPVGRGWNTKKNLLGFYNSLKGEYQFDEFGILTRLNEINNNPSFLKSFPLIVVLDEANLSPVEHYWSDFLGICDKESDRSIRINDPHKSEAVSLPDGFRFIFTINNDHTTELLSPRLLDRASIIKLEYDPQKSSESTTPSLVADTDMKFQSYNNIKSLFLPGTYSLNQAEKRIFGDILNILGEKDVRLGKQIPVSPRKIKLISQYCSVIRKLFNKYHDNQFLALDYGILQNIIPLINGHGKSFETRLEKVREECLKRSLIKTAQEIEEIILKGREFQNYSFF